VAHDPRRLAALRQGAQQRLGPEMLVDVDAQRYLREVDRFSEAVQ
jgi:hypothetical protein